MSELEVELFQTNPESIGSLMTEVESGKLALPQFQRNFIWAPSNTSSLLSSIMARYPAGALLMWKPDEDLLEPRPVADSPALVATPDRLILDGQQRVTALYRALEAKTSETYFVNLSELIDNDTFELREHESILWDSVVESQDLSARERRARVRKNNPVEPDHLTRSWQHANLKFPIGENFDDWIDELVDGATDAKERKHRRDVLRRVRDLYLDQYKNYRFPVITLTSAASLAAVCNVFEKLNSNSIRLGPFEILTAKFYKDGVNLRELWAEATVEHSVLRDPTTENDHGGFSIDPYLVLQAITLVKHRSPQRRAVLELLTSADVTLLWDKVVLALKRVIEWLQTSCGVIHKDLLPYQAMLVPLTGAWVARDQLSGPRKADALRKLEQYFWASTFTTNFEQGGASQAEKDYKDLVGWIEGQAHDGQPIVPEAISTIRIRADDLLAATANKKALLQGLMALTVVAGAKDFHNGEGLNHSAYVDQKLNSHHVFPRARLTDPDPATNVDAAGYSPELLLNRALIDGETNRRIGAKRPSAYLEEIVDAGVDVEPILSSHLIQSSTLATDDYAAFIQQRLMVVVEKLEYLTGVDVEPLTVAGEPPEDIDEAVE